MPAESVLPKSCQGKTINKSAHNALSCWQFFTDLFLSFLFLPNNFVFLKKCATKLFDSVVCRLERFAFK